MSVGKNVGVCVVAQSFILLGLKDISLMKGFVNRETKDTLPQGNKAVMSLT